MFWLIMDNRYLIETSIWRQQHNAVGNQEDQES